MNLKIKVPVEIMMDKRTTAHSSPMDDLDCEGGVENEQVVNCQTQYLSSSCSGTQTMTQKHISGNSPFTKDDINDYDASFEGFVRAADGFSEIAESPPRQFYQLTQHISGEAQTRDVGNNKDETTFVNKYSTSNSESGYSQKSKSRKAGNKPRQMLSLRTDVMNKNLFRAIRRECKNVFEKYAATNKLVCSKKPKHFMPNLEQFADHLLSSTTVNWEAIKDFNTKDF